MSEKKETSTALVRRARPDLSEADLASMIYRSNHWFDGRRLAGYYDVNDAASLSVENFQGADPGRSYLVYCETTQSFIGIVRGERFNIEAPQGHDRLRLLLYPMAEA